MIQVQVVEATPAACLQYLVVAETPNMEQYIDHIHKIVARYLHLNPDHRYLRDDLVSEGYQVLVNAWPIIESGEVKSPKAYLRKACYRRFWRVAKRERRNQPVGSAEEVFTTPDTIHRSDVLIDLELDERERQIVKLREGGYTDAEIGEEIGLSQSQVQRSRSDLCRRIERL